MTLQNVLTSTNTDTKFDASSLHINNIQWFTLALLIKQLIYLHWVKRFFFVWRLHLTVCLWTVAWIISQNWKQIQTPNHFFSFQIHFNLSIFFFWSFVCIQINSSNNFSFIQQFRRPIMIHSRIKSSEESFAVCKCAVS